MTKTTTTNRQMDSRIENLGQITFPAFSGLRVMMMPVRLEDPSTVHEVWRGAFVRLVELSAVKTGVAYLTIDEAVVQAGQTHRRPGLHVDGCGAYGDDDGGYAACGMLTASTVAARHRADEAPIRSALDAKHRPLARGLHTKPLRRPSHRPNPPTANQRNELSTVTKKAKADQPQQKHDLNDPHYAPTLVPNGSLSKRRSAFPGVTSKVPTLTTKAAIEKTFDKGLDALVPKPEKPRDLGEIVEKSGSVADVRDVTLPTAGSVALPTTPLPGVLLSSSVTVFSYVALDRKTYRQELWPVITNLVQSGVTNDGTPIVHCQVEIRSAGPVAVHPRMPAERFESIKASVANGETWQNDVEELIVELNRERERLDQLNQTLAKQNHVALPAPAEAKFSSAPY